MNNYDYGDSVKRLTEYAIKTYYDESDIEPIVVEIEFTDDLYERRLELAFNEADINDVKDQKEFIKNLNGTLVFPARSNEKPHILISNNAIDDSMQFIGTIIHELTHIHDFYDFVNYYSIKCLRDIEKHYNFQSLYFWTEFHARKRGYYFFRKFVKSLIQDKETVKEQVKYIEETECPFQFAYLKDELIKNENNSTQFMYNIMQFLGRYSVWQDLFPDECNEYTLPRELRDAFGDRIIDIYKFLYNHSTFEDIKDKFTKLKVKLDSFVL